ncbi:MAG: nuclear transport factor 2 family protein [Pyrinomonadaceae bacterium]
MRSIILLGSILMLSSVSLAQTPDNLSADLKKALTAYDAAWNKKDVGGVSKILAEDYVYFSSTGSLTNRKRTLEFLASPDYKLTFVERSEIVSLYNTNGVAVLSSRWKGRGMYGKEKIDDDQRCGLVFAKEKQQWRLISEHCAQIVNK